MGKKDISIKKLLASKQYDKLLMLELEKERLMPNRQTKALIGQFVLLYDLIPQTPFNTMLITETELRKYCGKFFKKEKKIDDEGSLQYIHYWGIEKTTGHGDGIRFYLINSKNNLHLLDEEDKND